MKRQKAFGAREWPLEKIIPYKRNPRTHPEKQVAMLANLMKKFGIDQPIVVDEKGIIIKGHGRRLAAIEAGFKKFPVVQRVGLSRADKKALRIADNQSSLMSGWDDDLLKEEFGDLRAINYEMEIMGFDDKKLVQFFADPATQPELAGMTFSVIVECESESDQRERLTQLSGMGMKCRALIS